MQINLRLRHILVPKEILHRAHILPRLQQMRRETLPEQVRPHRHSDPRRLRPLAHRPLQTVLQHMMSPHFTRAMVPRRGSPREDPEPLPQLRRPRIIRPERPRQPPVPPFASFTMIRPPSKSTSFTRSRIHAMSRSPAP